MVAATTAISSLGFALDLMVQRVLTHMHRGARRGAVVQVCDRPELGFGWEHAQGSKAVAGSREGCGRSESDGGRRKGNGVNPTSASLFIGGPLNLLVVVPSAVQHAPTDLFREVHEKISADLSLIG
jgi:hypothetical protein